MVEAGFDDLDNEEDDDVVGSAMRNEDTRSSDFVCNGECKGDEPFFKYRELITEVAEIEGDQRTRNLCMGVFQHAQEGEW